MLEAARSLRVRQARGRFAAEFRRVSADRPSREVTICGAKVQQPGQTGRCGTHVLAPVVCACGPLLQLADSLVFKRTKP